ncbi:Cytochrome b561 [Candidatus Rhodobacter oscarellae]|uniref:Cytochrome b561 n=1 Tax=Candidatus Rhodobacter oscarellae TaxID=1675527 RepID=A0A0J9E6H4_9RHOB|nr:Cytochrome b561 [Candidatus Rhodobacter lobularis]
MQAANSAASYGGVTKTFHWLTALLILTAFPLGMIANGLPFGTGEELAQKAWLFSLHKTVGIAAFLVALARILWALSQVKPAGLHPENRLETFMAELVHWLLYASMLIVPLSGWLHHAATEGFAPILWPLGQGLPLVPKSEPVAEGFAAVHFVFTKLLGLSVLLHIAGALKHVVIDRDATLARMLPGQPEVQVTPAPHGHAPMLAAAVIYAAGFAGALALANQDSHQATASATATALAAVPSQWQVTEGTIEITVDQLGNRVTGSFADWTAAINFSETAIEGRHGDAEVTIAVGSLTLGSVTAQALGQGFFEAEAFPTALFRADILSDADG